MVLNFVVVDDENTNNMISRIVIKQSYPEAIVKEFTDSSAALAYILSLDSVLEDMCTVLFLDLNMPILSGWDFLYAFKSFKNSLKQKIKVYILSSSVDERDLKRAQNISEVRDYLEKPLTSEHVQMIVKDLCPDFSKSN